MNRHYLYRHRTLSKHLSPDPLAIHSPLLQSNANIPHETLRATYIIHGAGVVNVQRLTRYLGHFKASREVEIGALDSVPLRCVVEHRPPDTVAMFLQIFKDLIVERMCLARSHYLHPSHLSWLFSGCQDGVEHGEDRRHADTCTDKHNWASFGLVEEEVAEGGGEFNGVTLVEVVMEKVGEPAELGGLGGSDFTGVRVSDGETAVTADGNTKV